jgi:hypothetical protein
MLETVPLMLGNTAFAGVDAPLPLVDEPDVL